MRCIWTQISELNKHRNFQNIFPRNLSWTKLQNYTNTKISKKNRTNFSLYLFSEIHKHKNSEICSNKVYCELNFRITQTQRFCKNFSLVTSGTKFQNYTNSKKFLNTFVIGHARTQISELHKHKKISNIFPRIHLEIKFQNYTTQ